MKKKFWVLLFVLLLVAFTGCAGEEGKQPPQDPIGLDALAVTEWITEEWTQSAHRYGITATFDRGIGCAKCHDGVGFSEQQAYASTDFIPAHQTGIDCQACHTGFGQERLETGVVELPFMSEPYEAGKGAVCASCHNSNRDPEEIYQQSKAGTLQRYAYPHYGMNAAVLTGQGGMEIEGREYIVSIAHATVEDSCVACHMPETADGYRQHTFVADPAHFEQTCGDCHVGPEQAFDLNGLQNEVKTMLKTLEEAILADTGAVEIDAGGGVFIYLGADGEPITEISHEAYVATYNWKLIYGDGSYGVHNPLYAKSLLQQSYEFLTGESL